MEKNQELLSKIKAILIKKACGFYYDEECNEYIQKQNNNDPQIHMEEILQGESKRKNKSKETNLILTKKKVTSHYIPPDMLAIKILLENFGEKVESDLELENMSETELLKYKDNLVSDINNLIKKEDTNES